MIEQVLMTILAKGHVLLEDIPGVGKTTLALSFAKVMGVDYHRIQFTPDVTPSDVVGFSLYDRQSGEFQYKPGQSCATCFWQMRSTVLPARHRQPCLK